MGNPNYICPDCGSTETVVVQSLKRMIQCNCGDCGSMFWIDLDMENAKGIIENATESLKNIENEMGRRSWNKPDKPQNSRVIGNLEFNSEVGFYIDNWLDRFFDDTEKYLKDERDKHAKKSD